MITALSLKKKSTHSAFHYILLPSIVRTSLDINGSLECWFSSGITYSLKGLN